MNEIWKEIISFTKPSLHILRALCSCHEEVSMMHFVSWIPEEETLLAIIEVMDYCALVFVCYY